MKNMEQFNWRQQFEPFYGKEYCTMITIPLEMFRDEFQCNSFHFQEGWVRPTLEMLKRLTHQGFSVRTKDHVVIHLTKPLESMTYGEFYFQAGRKMPGRLSLKFNRRCPTTGVHVIQQTVLTPEEESVLAANPVAFLASLRQQAQYTQPDYQNLLTTLVLLNNQYEPRRVNVNEFFQNFLQPPLNALSQANYMRLDKQHPSPDSVFFPNFLPEAICSYPISTRHNTPTNVYGSMPKPRSGSEGLIPQFRFPEPETRHLSTRQTGPVENDETKQNDASSSSDGNQYIPVNKLSEGIKSQDLANKLSTSPNANKPVSKLFASKEMPTEPYVDTAHGVAGQRNPGWERRESNDSGSGRTNVRSEYVVNALSSLTLDGSTPSDDLEASPFGDPNRRPSHETMQNGANYPFILNTPMWADSASRHPVSVNAWLQTCPSVPTHHVRFRTPMMQEDYTGTLQALGHVPDAANSWTSHQQPDSHAIYQINHPQYGQSYLSYDPPSLMCHHSPTGQSVTIPLTVEELNRLSELRQQRGKV